MDSSPSPPEKVDLYIKLFSVRFPVSILVLIISTAAFIPLILPLFDPGPPINSDIGVHYSSLACLKDNPLWWSLPTAWCTHGQAGLARFQRYGIVHAYITVFLSFILPLELAFKIMLVATFMLLPTAAFFFLQWIGFPLGGAIAYTLLLLEPGGYFWGGYILHFINAGFINNLGTAFSLINLFGLIWLLSKPSPLRLIISSMIFAIHFLSHPASALWIPIALSPAAILYRKEIISNLKILGTFPFFFFFFIAFWFLPALSKSAYFYPPGLGGFGDFDFSGFFTRFPISQRTLIISSFLSSLYLLFRKERPIKLIGCVAFLIPLVWIGSRYWVSNPYFSFFTIDRSVYELRTFLFLATSLILGGCHPRMLRPYRRPLLCIGVTLLILFSIPFYEIEKKNASNLITGKDIEPGLLEIYKFLERANGRIIAENTFLRIPNTAYSRSQIWALSGWYSNKEFLGNADFWYIEPDFSVAYINTLFGRDLSNYTDEELKAYLSRLNVQYIWTFSHFGERFKQLFPLAQGFNLTLGNMYETPGEHSYFYFSGGHISNVSYTKFFGSARTSSQTGGQLFFKVRQWPNWHATIDDAQTGINQDPLGLMFINVPSGEHAVTFSYRLNFIDWYGYFVTIFGIILSISFILLCRDNKPLLNNI